MVNLCRQLRWTSASVASPLQAVTQQLPAHAASWLCARQLVSSRMAVGRQATPFGVRAVTAAAAAKPQHPSSGGAAAQGGKDEGDEVDFSDDSEDGVSDGSEDDDDVMAFEISESDALGAEEEWTEAIDTVGCPEVNTGSTAWGEVALQAAQKVLAGPVGEGLELFSLTAVAQSKRLGIRLDKLSDRYGSPALDEIEAFCRAFNAEFAAALGEEAAGLVEVEVSSPGAERTVRVPADLARFADLPMKVEFANEQEKVDTRVLQLVSLDAAGGTSEWALANVRINRQQGAKGSNTLSRKQRDLRFNILLNQIQRVNLFIDL